ncbi:hypothetical protein EJB05_50880, partial [Eragrostis curvula]
MDQSDDHRAVSRHLKVLLPSSSHKLRISKELARQLGVTALVVSPVGSKVWRVEVGRDGDGAFLGRGWPEFVAAHGLGDLWFVVFRHEGGGTLTVKAFDTSLCLRQFSRPLNVAANRRSSPRPQFITPLLPCFTEKMVIPPKFVRNHITDVETNSHLPVRLNLCGKYWCVEPEKDPSGNVFLAGGWSWFLASNGITEGEAVLLRYEGNMVFTVKVFGLDGCHKSFVKSRKMPSGVQLETEQSDRTKIKKEPDAPSSSTGKRKNANMRPRVAEKKRPRSSAPPSNKAPSAVSKCTYEIGPPAWIKKEIKAYALKTYLPLTPCFCKAIGFSNNCVITLTTSTGKSATTSWQVTGRLFNSRTSPQLGHGWTSFCRDNGLKEGDVCTFNIIQATLWHVDIERRS